MNILVTGYKGFIGKNLCFYLSDLNDYKLILANRDNFEEIIDKYASNLDFVFHLAGENRSDLNQSFIKNNVLNTKYLTEKLQSEGNDCPIVFTSSTQSIEDNIYGATKKEAEKIIINHSKKNNSQVFIFKLPNIFGKWAKPQYNSIVSTLICDLINNKKTQIWDGDKNLDLLYIDDVIHLLLECINNQRKKINIISDFNAFKTNVNYLYKILQSFHEDRKKIEFKLDFYDLERKLYSTYLSYLNIKECVFPLKSFADSRGSFTEFLKEPISGQISVFNAFPNIVRGDHFHHTKVERFVVVSGKALFTFKNIVNLEKFDLKVTGDNPQIVETFPGWNHSIKNMGKEKLSGIIWSNEVFNKEKPDTYVYKEKK
jgi:UDP-2-acetamido-2,6-beta-L-arabino-hexul-4-ose reductase